MARAEGLDDVAVVLAALVGVADQQADGRAGGLALEHAGQDLDKVFFLALRDVARSAGLAAVEIGLDVLGRQRHARRAAVDDGTDGRAVRLAEGGDGKQQAQGIARHDRARKGATAVRGAKHRETAIVRLTDQPPMPSSSTSKFSVALGGIVPGTPRAP